MKFLLTCNGVLAIVPPLNCPELERKRNSQVARPPGVCLWGKAAGAGSAGVDNPGVRRKKEARGGSYLASSQSLGGVLERDRPRRDAVHGGGRAIRRAANRVSANWAGADGGCAKRGCAKCGNAGQRGATAAAATTPAHQKRQRPIQARRL